MVVKNIIKQLIMVFKRLYYSFFYGNKIDVSSYISSNVLLNKCWVGKYCYIGNNCVMNKTTIGNYCSIAPSVQIGGMEHSWWANSTSTKLSEECISNEKTLIEHDVWIAANCIIKQGVHIGIGAVVGANSFVNKDVPPFAIVVGSPAKIIKYRFDAKRQDKILESQYWMYSPNKAKQILQTIS